MIIITGGLGFIGSNILSKLNDRNKKDILLVDSPNKEKLKNIKGLNYVDLIEKKNFLKNLYKNKYKNIDYILHQGACTDTQELNLEYLMYNNYEYSKKILQYSNNNNINFVYASSASIYGNCKKIMREKNIINEKKIKNYYALSKLMFDKYVLDNKKKIKSAIGLRYFNVYGQNEYHKKKMSSPVLSFYNQIKRDNVCKIFGRYDGFNKGEHTRDFIHVDDVVDINIWAAKQKFVDIINVGTGISSSFNLIANTIIKKLDNGKVEYINFPNQFKGKYQSFTKADISKLRKLGYNKRLTDIDKGISKYLKILINE
tara:strand:+ start:4266 stop:5207 length:942 start_codon:yes stop_codon:yes gene_type:complete